MPIFNDRGQLYFLLCTSDVSPTVHGASAPFLTLPLAERLAEAAKKNEEFVLINLKTSTTPVKRPLIALWQVPRGLL